MAKKKLSPNAERRAIARDQVKLARKKLQLATLSDGGAPERPVEVTSAAQVEPHARSMPCPVCESSVRIEEHAAQTIDHARLRLVRVVCTRCGVVRTIYFRLAPELN